MLKLWHHLRIYSGTWWFNYENSFFLSSLFTSLFQYVSHSFHLNIWIYSSNFYTGASYYPDLQTILSPSCFNKTSCLVFTQCQLLHFDTRSSIWFTLVIFPKLTTLSRNNCPWGKTTSWTSSPTPYTIWHPQKRPLWSFHHSPISWVLQT